MRRLRPTRRPAGAARSVLLLLLLLLWAGGASAQEDLAASRRRLQEIRNEQTQLRRQLERIRSQVHDVSAEIRNIQQQIDASEELIAELDFQQTQMEARIDTTSASLVDTQDRLLQSRALLHRRLRDLYKRGPLRAFQVLLTAESFSDLLNRYKYLHAVARRDRALVEEIDRLRESLRTRERDLRRGLDDLHYLREQRAQEHARLQTLQGEHQATLSSLQSHERSAAERVAELARDERRLTGLIERLEERRREAERAAAARRAAGRAEPERASTLTRTEDLGALDWPVEGSLLYRFGRVRQPNGTTIRWNGVGIGAAAGSPVRAVESGTVVMAGPFEGYGPTVVLSHGGGYYSLYLYLQGVAVEEGQEVAKGARVGTVGGESTPEGAHLEFQIRAPGGQAVDPLEWLRARAR